MLELTLLFLLLFGNQERQRQEMLINAYKDYEVTIINVGQPIADILGYVHAEGNPIARAEMELVNYNPIMLDLGGALYLILLSEIVERMPKPFSTIFTVGTSLVHMHGFYTWNKIIISSKESQPEIIRTTILKWDF